MEAGHKKSGEATHGVGNSVSKSDKKLMARIYEELLQERTKATAKIPTNGLTES